MKTITRKTMLYKTAVDYQLDGTGEPVNDYAMNHALGCPHGCKYPCYAMQNALRWKQVESYEDWRRAKPVENCMELLEAELDRLPDVSRVHLCFTTDPFPHAEDLETERGEGLLSNVPGPIAAIHSHTMESIQALNGRGIPVTVLTKGMLPRFRKPNPKIEGDAAWLADVASEHGGLIYMVPPTVSNPHPDNYYGITLTSLDERFREEWEPGAAPYALRLKSLRELHEASCKTWVSMEPYPALRWNMGDAVARSAQSLSDPHAGLKYLLGRVAFVDRIVFGRWNYNKKAPCDVEDPIRWYSEAAGIVRRFCRELGIECVIKDGTE